MFQDLIDSINRLKSKLDEAEMLDAIEDLGDICKQLEGIIPGFVNPLPPVSPPPAA